MPEPPREIAAAAGQPVNTYVPVASPAPAPAIPIEPPQVVDAVIPSGPTEQATQPAAPAPAPALTHAEPASQPAQPAQPIREGGIAVAAPLRHSETASAASEAAPEPATEFAFAARLTDADGAKPRTAAKDIQAPSETAAPTKAEGTAPEAKLVRTAAPDTAAATKTATDRPEPAVAPRKPEQIEAEYQPPTRTAPEPVRAAEPSTPAAARPDAGQPAPAPSAPSAPPAPPTAPVARTADPRPAAPPEVFDAAAPSHFESSPKPVREMLIRVTDEGARSTDIRLVEHAGELRVAVRASSGELANTLRSDLPELVARLEHRDVGAEIWRPAAASSSSATADQDSAADHWSSAARQQSGYGEGESRHSRQQQQHATPDWVDELEEGQSKGRRRSR